MGLFLETLSKKVSGIVLLSISHWLDSSFSNKLDHDWIFAHNYNTLFKISTSSKLGSYQKFTASLTNNVSNLK